MIPVLGGLEEGGISWVDEADVQARAARFGRSSEPVLGRLMSSARPVLSSPRRAEGWIAHYLNAFLASVAAR
jgi:hypothetical protein